MKRLIGLATIAEIPKAILEAFNSNFKDTKVES